MMIWRFVFLMLANCVALVFLAGCGDSSNSDSSYLTGDSTKVWRFKLAWWRDKQIDLPECLLDDVMLLHADQTGQFVYGGIPCNEGENSDTQFFTWDYDPLSGIFAAPGLSALPDGISTFTVTTLRDDELKFNNGTTVDGDAYIYVLEPAIEDRIDSIPFALGGKVTKSWRYVSVQRNGEEVPLSDCQKNAMILFNMDGTNLYVFGDPACTPVERPDGKWLHFYVRDNGTTILRSRLEASSTIDERLMVEELNSRIFKFRTSSSQDVDTVSLVPYFMDGSR